MTVPFKEFGCQREFSLLGKASYLDSPHRQDAEGLREAFQDVPEAIELLDSYQDTKRAAQRTAYLGTVGLAFFLFAPIVANTWMKDSQGHLTPGAQNLKRVSFWGGLGLAACAFSYSFIVLRVNERKLDRALEKYNESRPKNDLQFEFSTGIFF